MNRNDHRRRPTLVIFSGLPASGKSTLAQAVARELPIVWLRIDTIEQALRDLCGIDVQGEGYRLAYRIAADNLRLGSSVGRGAAARLPAVDAGPPDHRHRPPLRRGMRAGPRRAARRGLRMNSQILYIF